jgi:hypothetical protein
MAQYKNSGIRLDGEAADRNLTGIAAAWSHITGGASTPTASGALNISSITDSGTGTYTNNLTASMNDALYAVSGSKGSDLSNAADFMTGTFAVGSYQSVVLLPGTAYYDADPVTTTAMGDLA